MRHEGGSPPHRPEVCIRARTPKNSPSPCKLLTIVRQRMKSFRLIMEILVLLSAGFLAAGNVPAQGTKADYERADNLQQRFANKIFKSTIRANWFANNTKFWYRNDLA